MRSLLASTPLALLLTALLTVNAHADLAMSIEGLSVDETGGSFLVNVTPIGTPKAGETEPGAYGINLMFSNFSAGLGTPLSVSATNQLSGMTGPIFGSSSFPATVNDGDTITFVGFGTGDPEISASGSTLARFDFTVPGGFPVGESFDVALVPAASSLAPTSVGSFAVGGGLTLSGSTASISAVPEPSSFLLIGLVAGMVGTFKWYRRRKAA